MGRASARRAAAVALAAAVLAGPAASSGSEHTCSVPAHAHELAKDGDLYAYWQTSGAIVTVSACARPHGRAFQVYSGRRSLTQSLSLTDIATCGPILGIDAQASDQYAEGRLLVVVDASTRRTLLAQGVESWPLGNPQPSPGFGGYAIDANGDVAWIETDAGGARLMLRTSSGRRTLDAAASISRVAISGGEVRWVSDGSPRAASLR